MPDPLHEPSELVDAPLRDGRMAEKGI